MLIAARSSQDLACCIRALTVSTCTCGRRAKDLTRWRDASGCTHRRPSAGAGGATTTTAKGLRFSSNRSLRSRRRKYAPRYDSLRTRAWPGQGGSRRMFTNDGIKEGADGYALLQRDLAEAVRDLQLDGDGVRRPLPRVFASAARLNFKISEWRLLRKYSSTVGVTSRCRRCSPRRLAMRTSALVTCAYVPTSIPAGPDADRFGASSVPKRNRRTQ
jgi:hypothetical protein